MCTDRNTAALHGIAGDKDSTVLTLKNLLIVLNALQNEHGLLH